MVAVAREAGIVLGRRLCSAATHGGCGIRRLCGKHGHVLSWVCWREVVGGELSGRSGRAGGRSCRSVYSSISYMHHENATRDKMVGAVKVGMVVVVDVVREQLGW